MALEKLGPYKLDKLLGRGGMGAVYAGVNEITGERAAVKVLSPHLSDSADFRERFIGEVETLKKLKHPNIVQLHGYGHEDDHLFYVMELVDGRSLQDELSSGRRFEWREVARIGVEICRALKHAHDSGVIHRDLKPANLLIDKTEQIKLTDFGIAKLYGATNITAAGGILGTADYMAPEQAEGKPIGVRCDLYSLGSVLYALLTGRPPFAAKTLAEVIHGLRFEKPVPVRRIALNTPAEFEAIIQQLLEKDPAKRIASAFAVSNLLRAMEHALSLETQVGALKLDDLPDPAKPPKPSKASTQGGGGSVSATLATGLPGTQQSNNATVDIGSAAEDYRLSAPLNESGTAATMLKSGIHTHPTRVAEAAEAPRAKFVTLEEEEARRREAEQGEETVPAWLLITALIALVVISCGIGWYALAPPSADSLYRKIAAAAESEDPDRLVAVKDDIQQFLQVHAQDERAKEVGMHLESLERLKLQRGFEYKARLGRIDALSPVERAYLEALRLAEKEPEQAMEQFQAIAVVFSEGDPNDSFLAQRQRQSCVQLAQRQVLVLQEKIEQTAEAHRHVIMQQIARAKQLETDDAKAAAAIRQGLIRLYGAKSWAQDLLATIQETPVQEANVTTKDEK